jgi:polyhydroxyalkanoate synthesis repressor PhaR
MPTIKRYPNRKLYDTEAKQYITLEGVAELIRRGEDVHVFDHQSGEDLTTLTLTQIILEEEKKQSGFLPSAVLSSLVKAGGETVGGMQRVLASSLGWWSQFDEEVKLRLDSLVSQGELTKEDASSIFRKIVAAGEVLKETAASGSKHNLEELLKQRGVPNRDELVKLNMQLDELAVKIEALEKARKAEPPKKTTPKRTKKATPTTDPE